MTVWYSRRGFLVRFLKVFAYFYFLSTRVLLSIEPKYLWILYSTRVPIFWWILYSTRVLKILVLFLSLRLCRAVMLEMAIRGYYRLTRSPITAVLINVWRDIWYLNRAWLGRLCTAFKPCTRNEIFIFTWLFILVSTWNFTWQLNVVRLLKISKQNYWCCRALNSDRKFFGPPLKLQAMIADKIYGIIIFINLSKGL